MKLKYIFSSLVAVCALAIGCTKNYPTELENIKVSQSTIGLSASKPDSVTIKVNSKEAWTIEVSEEVAKWLNVTPVSGEAGVTEVKFKALKKTEACNKATLKIVSGNSVQYLYIQQGTPEVKEVSCKEINEGPDGATYKVSGTVESIAESAVYGNWYIADETGHVYVYGTKDSNGETKKGALISYGLEVGDKVTIEGPKTTYNGTVELVDVTVLKIEKSLLKVCNEEVLKELKAEGDTVDVKMIVKGQDFYFSTKVSDTVATELNWATIKKISKIPAVKKADPDTTVATVVVAENVDDTRKGLICFTSTLTTDNGLQSSTIPVAISQKSGLSAYSLPYNETFESDLGAFEITDVTIPEGKTFVWAWNSSKYAKASSGVKADSKSYLESPLIDLGTATNAHVSFEHVQKYAGDVYEELTLWVSGNNGTSWEQLLIPYYSSGKDWNFINSGNISLSAYAGKQIKLRFQYVSNANAYATWEIKNLKVVEGIGELTSIAEISGMAYSKDVTENFEATLSDALVTYVNGSNVLIEDATGGLLLYKKDHGFAAGDKISGKVSGKITFYGGFAEATDLNVSEATVEKEQTVTPTEITIDKLLADFNRYISCQVVLKDITLDAAIVAGGNRNVNVKAGESTIAGYAKTKTFSLDADVKGELICYPCLNNSWDNKQVGIWDSAHFKPANNE